MQTSKGLLKNSAAAPTLEESPTSTRVIGQKFDYTPFSGPNYQVCMPQPLSLVPAHLAWHCAWAPLLQQAGQSCFSPVILPHFL